MNECLLRGDKYGSGCAEAEGLGVTKVGQNCVCLGHTLSLLDGLGLGAWVWGFRVSLPAYKIYAVSIDTSATFNIGYFQRFKSGFAVPMPTSSCSNQSKNLVTSSPLNRRPCCGAMISISSLRTRSNQCLFALLLGIQRS